jgi:hypothetical protein
MKVYIVFSPMYEENVSIHTTKEGAEKKKRIMNDADNLHSGRDAEHYIYEEFELEE